MASGAPVRRSLLPDRLAPPEFRGQPDPLLANAHLRKIGRACEFPWSPSGFSSLIHDSVFRLPRYHVTE